MVDGSMGPNFGWSLQVVSHCTYMLIANVYTSDKNVNLYVSHTHTPTLTPTHVIRKTNNTDASKTKTGYLHIGEWMWRIANGTDEQTREEINWEKGPIMAILIKNPLTTITVYVRTHTHTHPAKHGRIPLHLYIWWWTSYQYMCCCILYMRVSIVVWVNAWKSQSKNKDFWYEFNDFLNFMETEKLCCCWYNRLIDTAFFLSRLYDSFCLSECRYVITDDFCSSEEWWGLIDKIMNDHNVQSIVLSSTVVGLCRKC